MATHNYDAANAGQLVAHITDANGKPKEDEFIITLTGNDGDFELDSSFTPAGSLFGATAFPVIHRDVTIIGNGVTIQRTSGTAFRFFGVNSKGNSDYVNAKLTLNDVGLVGGNSGGSGGGAIINDGPMILNRCLFYQNNGTYGGAIYNGDGQRLEVNGTTFTENSSSVFGGAIYSSSSSALIVRDSAFVGNSTTGDGGAIYTNLNSEINIRNTSIAYNTASSGTQSSVYNNGSVLLDARCCWWGAPDGPSGAGPGSGDVVNGSPSGNVSWAKFRTTLPRFTSTALVPTNPALPPTVNGCTFVVIAAFVNVRRGPSSEDLQLQDGGNPVTLVQNDTAQPRAYAIDEAGNTWLGFVHPARPNYLSWAVHILDQNPTTQLQGCSLGNLPNISTQEQPQEDWDENLSFIVWPMSSGPDTNPTFFPFRGIGITATDYSLLAGCHHPGHDLVPVDKTDVALYALADGMVVGMGQHNVAVAPGNWGATEGGYNLVIRTGGRYVLYGHLSEIDSFLQLGTRVCAGDTIGEVAPRSNDTHLHIEVKAFSVADSPSTHLLPRFGAIRGTSPNPSLITDPVVFMSNQGTNVSSGPRPDPCTQTNYTAVRYGNINLGTVLHDANVYDDTSLSFRLKCYNLYNPSSQPSVGTCTTPKP